MDTQLLDWLVCPACLPKERKLAHTAQEEQDGDIVTGTLSCPACGARYAITDGLADLTLPGETVPAPQARYDLDRLGASYLWSQYADLWHDPEASAAYTDFAAACQAATGPTLDAGCSVGRFTLELAARTGWAVGVDLSRNFVALARKIARNGGLAFDAPLQGLRTTRFSFVLPDRLRGGRTEFLRADAQHLPFRQEAFGLVASLNVVDKLPEPRRHLRQCQRVCAAPAGLLVADPFSWSTDIAPPTQWLGGTPETGDSAAATAAFLAELPGWSATTAGEVAWTIRDHKNRYERIKSELILASRTAA